MFRMMKYAAPLAALALLLTLTASRTMAEDAKKETGKIEGTVVDKDGKPVKDAEVGVFHVMGKKGAKGAAQGQAEGEKPPKGDKPIAVVPSVKSDDKGEFTLNDVPAGDYTVRAFLKGQGSAHENVTVKAGESAKVELKLVYKSKTPAAGSEKPAADKQSDK